MNKLLLFALLCLPLGACTFEGDTIGSIRDTYEIKVSPGQWIPDGTPGQPGFYLKAPFTVDYITPEVLYDGAVLVYADNVDSQGEVQLPYALSLLQNGSRAVEMLGYRLSNGMITFTIDQSNFLANPYNFDVTFKIVVIR